MTTPGTPACPECAGPQMAGHPGGLLEIQHRIGCTLLAAEDATRAADYERAAGRMAMVRAATATELLLIAALGYPPPDDQITGYDTDNNPLRAPAIVVTFLTPGVRHRTWPPEPTPPETETTP